MPKRVAVLSDIHGVLPALEAVLAGADLTTADRIVILGDMAAGPQPARSWTSCWPSATAPHGFRATRTACSSSIAEASARPLPERFHLGGGAARRDASGALSRLPPSLTLTIDGLGQVLFCHATPRDDEEVVLVDSRIARWDEVFAELDPVSSGGVRPHAHAVRSSGKRPAGGESGKRRHAVRQSRRALGASRAGRRAAPDGVRPGCRLRADDRGVRFSRSRRMGRLLHSSARHRCRGSADVRAKGWSLTRFVDRTE